MAYRIEDAATALGVGRTLIYKMISEGQLTSVKVGKRSLIAVSELDAFLARGGSK
jgi:excisionase family DNA binding protein